MLKDFLAPLHPISTQNIKTGLFTVAGTDGYRVAITYSCLTVMTNQSFYLLMMPATPMVDDLHFSLQAISSPTEQLEPFRLSISRTRR